MPIGPLVAGAVAGYAAKKAASKTKKKKTAVSKSRPVQGPQPSKRIVRKNKRKAWVGKVKSKLEEGASRRRAKRLAKKGKVTYKGGKVSSKAYTKGAMKRKKAAGFSPTPGKISKGAVSAVATQGGTFAKYKKDSKAAGDFRSKFKSACGGGAKSFKWQGRSYACKKA